MIAVAIAVVSTPAAGPPHLARIQAQDDSFRHAAAAPSCTLGVIGDLLGVCGTPTSNVPATQSTSCSLLQQILGMCVTPVTPDTTSPSGKNGDPTTTTTSSPPTTTTTAATTTTTAVAAAPSGSDGSGPCAGTSPPVAPPSGTWSCTFDDEFNGSTFDTSKWEPALTSSSGYTTGPFGAQVCYVNNPDTISESGGSLNLSVVQVPYFACNQPGGWALGTAYEGGMVQSQGLFSQKYGFFQVRAAMPASSVPGLQETLWLYPQNETLYGPWPNSGEIDYGEFYSNYPNNDVSAMHYPGSGNDPNANAEGRCTGASTVGQFNTYALSWTPTTMTTYFNGVPCITDVYAPYVTWPDSAPAPFNQPFFLAFTQALGMDTSDSFQPGTTQLPATTKIDWVRVWQY